jgi:MEMO1 family protein
MRTSAVAGTFYPAERGKLDIMLTGYLKKAKADFASQKAVGGVCPHAGYVYSGETAAITYVSLEGLADAETIVVIGPNHTGQGSLISISLEDWDTPLGVALCDVPLAKKIQKNARLIDFDERAHLHEHSVEVQLPFIKKINPRAKVVCVCMMGQDLESAQDLGGALAKSLDPKKHIVIASSDFSHYLPSDEAEKKDKKALEFIEDMDAPGFQKALEKYGWSVCGFGPISALMEYAKAKGVKKAKTMRYANSGRASGDYLAVVGYASVLFPQVKK